MNNSKIPFGKAIHCTELSSGRSKTGNLEISEYKIDLNLFSYDEHFSLYNENPIFLQTESAKIVSLYGTLEISSGSHNTKDASVHHCAFSSNIAVVGDNKWTWSHRVKRCQFSLPRIDSIFENTKEYKKLKYLSLRSTKWIDPQIFTVSADAFIIRYRYHISYTAEDEFPSKMLPHFEIEFADSVDLEQYYKISEYLCSFFSLALAYPLEPHSFKISDVSRAGWTRRVNRKNYTEDHAVFYSEWKRELPSYGLRTNQIFFIVPDAINTLKACISTWMDRRDEWINATRLMQENLYYQNEFSTERLLNACRWFEQIPITDSEKIISKKHATNIGDAAAIKAIELGYDTTIAKRVSSSLSQMRDETHKERFSRLTKLVEHKFGANLLGDRFIQDLEMGMRYRGIAAHSLFNFKDKEDIDAFRGIYALEILCMLLTIIDLPLNAETIANIRLDSRIQNYRVI